MTIIIILAAVYVFSMPFSHFVSAKIKVSEALTLIACFEQIPNAILGRLYMVSNKNWQPIIYCSLPMT